MSLDMVNRGACVVTPDQVNFAAIGITQGRIAAIGNDLGPTSEVIEAEGLITMPGGIDSHVHISQPSGTGTGTGTGIEMADAFDSATRAAAFGGSTTILPFCRPRGDTPPASGRGRL